MFLLLVGLSIWLLCGIMGVCSRLGLGIGCSWVIIIVGVGVRKLGYISLSRCCEKCGNLVFCFSWMWVVRKVLFFSRCFM